MVAELGVLFVGLLVYLLGIVTPNHHPERTVKSFGGGVAQVLLIVFILSFYHELIWLAAGDAQEKYYEIAILACSSLLIVIIIAIRYYAVEETIRQWTLEDLIAKVR